MVDLWDFSGSLAVKTALQCNGIQAETLHASWPKQNKTENRENIATNSIKTF